MDPWTLAYLAGHRHMNITKRDVHPQERTIRAAMGIGRARCRRWAYFWAYRPNCESRENGFGITTD
jgi:hypothetical protein